MGRRGSRVKPEWDMTSSDLSIVLPIMIDGHLVGMVRHGTVGTHPIHSAACALFVSMRSTTDPCSTMRHCGSETTSAVPMGSIWSG